MSSTNAIVAVGAYLLGSIPFGYILLRVFRGQDVRATGSGNIGATNVARSAPALGFATLVLDAAKGFFAVEATLLATQRHFIGTGAASPQPEANWLMCGGTAALCAILGHMFPVWLKFKGGKGVATGVGAFLALSPIAVLISVVVFAALVALTRYVSLGSIVAAAVFPVLAYLLNRGEYPLAVVLIMAACSGLIIARHHQNIRRLLSGTEHRFGARA